MTEDFFDLQRFAAAQEHAIGQALAELRAGRKTTHWMWFIFPQLRGLGHSTMAQRYGISGLAEARAYLAHSLLGPRLIECTEAAVQAPATGVTALFGTPDDMKFRSSMTLFTLAAPDTVLFSEALNRWCGGKPDESTLALLHKQLTG